MQSIARSMAGGRTVHVAWTDRADGDLAIGVDPARLDADRRAVIDRPWVWLRQVHGRDVVEVADGDARCGSEADALVTRRDDVALAVHSADCAVLGLWSDDGVIAAVHCGWRGLEAGVVDAAVDALRSRSDGALSAVLGPSIGSECYEFGAVELDRLRASLGEVVVATTTAGTPALDVRAGVRSRLASLGVDLVAADDRCTSCEADTFFSHRARSETGRQALVVWMDR